MRFYSFVPLHTWGQLVELIEAEGRGDDWIRWGGVKGLIDGSLGTQLRCSMNRTPMTLRAAGSARAARGVAGAGARCRCGGVADCNARNRRCGEPGCSESVPGSGGSQWSTRQTFRDRTCATPALAGRSALRSRGRDRLHAAIPRNRRQPVGRDRWGRSARTRPGRCVHCSIRRRA